MPRVVRNNSGAHKDVGHAESCQEQCRRFAVCRKDDAGQAVAAGGYSLDVTATAADGSAVAVSQEITGTVTKVEWINPHAWFHIDVTEPAAQKGQKWMIEAGNPHNLFRRGFSKDVIKPGMTIVVDGYASKDGSRRANGRDLTLPSGQTLFMGSSGTGAPRDGKDATER